MDEAELSNRWAIPEDASDVGCDPTFHEEVREAVRVAVRRCSDPRPTSVGAFFEMLFEGRCTIVDRFDDEQLSYVVAAVNASEDVAARALSPRERAVLLCVSSGRLVKCVAFDLGIAPATAGCYLTDARRKTGLGSRAEIARWLGDRENWAEAESGEAEHDLPRITVGGQRFVFATAWAVVPTFRAAHLTKSELAVASLVSQGLSTADIARARRASHRTIANQLAALYRKLSVGSRVELLALLAANSVPNEPRTLADAHTR